MLPDGFFFFFGFFKLGTRLYRSTNNSIVNTNRYNVPPSMEQMEHDMLVLYRLKHQSVSEYTENHVNNNVLSNTYMYIPHTIYHTLERTCRLATGIQGGP